MPGRRECSFNRRAQVNADHFTGSPLRGQFGVTPFATPAFEYNLVFEKLRRYRSYPTQKLLFVLVIGLGEVLPLPAKAGGSGGFFCFNFIERSEPRHPAYDGPQTRTGHTGELTLDDLFSLTFVRRQRDRACARWT